MQVETSREHVAVMVEGIEHLQGNHALRHQAAKMLETLISERDAATARAEAAENALFTLRNRAGCGPDQSGPDVWQQRDAAIAERDALRDEWEEIAAGPTPALDEALAQARREGMEEERKAWAVMWARHRNPVAFSEAMQKHIAIRSAAAGESNT